MSLVYLPENAWSLRYGPDYFTVAIIKYLVKEDEYALYELQIQNGRRNWKVLRRFSEFDGLQSRYESANVLTFKCDPKLTTCCSSVCASKLATDCLNCHQRPIAAGT
ncbi:hypothetical protein, variant 2 [Phytophthora nicotianae CJ01A1]|uniref:PX domain-containing protein n=6 Tax=Phytophthora nicotianae TaxID=4792 RepID=W2PQH2_PHYN3|nr:hypothetical protein, variant 2 [Phytophthora nicotianae INRA-310]ETI36980.1 hypothetical protein, variant 2 [Phytophthora nicotianae P1569]ETK77200.1 hypothetical protein, variant 2 [Phytophthora nicotianae]ETO65704.1 hypothetical protein, variant 2 [Phytophthora nicotianae P1976]ETP06805.1 hypothetical protein, variant 2 [Phytophthora nicotianae CJ01A1]ETP34910.1 hypothetical protein, variant 2 [Phytophthora nicotianae P10297]KUF84876.1 hypothetical protein AM587_10006022 [Phytophthora n